jgi:1,4-alpha-glucan branching enzyme
MDLKRTLFFKKFALLPMLFVILFAAKSLQGQTITSNPSLPTDQDSLVVIFDATGTGLQGYTGDVYAHTGVTIEGVGNWQHVIGSWGNNTTQPKLTRTGPNLYTLKIAPSIRGFYNVPAARKITGLDFVFRSANGSQQTINLFLDVFELTLSVAIINPPKGEPIVEKGSVVELKASALLAQTISLYLDDQLVASSSTESEVTYNLNTADFDFGTYWVYANASDGTNTVKDSTYIFIRPQPTVAALPSGVIPGINYITDESVTLVLHDPPAKKEYVFVIGDFNNWMVNEDYYMNVTPAGDYFWLTITDLVPQKEYGFQYFIDNEIRIADPYTDKVLDPGTDRQIINDGRYPGLIPYPYELTFNPASVLQTAREPYEWKTQDFTPPAVEDLVIYELLIRDFLQNNTYQGVRDTLQYLKRLGINAIELMPVTNFEGNLSWGYNPSFFFAPDKFYGPRRELKKLIDEAHSLGMAVIVDMVWNHSWGQSPLLQMYFDRQNNRPSDDNPWYSDPIYDNPGMNFGYKFDHGSQYFIEFMDRANTHWMEEYKVDGFRFDLTKGFTTRYKGPNDPWGSLLDQERIDNLVRMYNQIKGVNPEAYVILEHLADNAEERVLANAGMLMWGNMNHNYNEATMGWHENNKSDLRWGSYKARNWDHPNLITYMESHDEERLMVKNLLWGNKSGDYNITELSTALRRLELAAAFFFTIPGPKMIWQFGELGYDVSIDHNGRVGSKPVRWEYYNDWRRKRVHDVFAALINLKTEQDVFRTTDFTLSTAGALKRIHLNHTSANVTVLGNFDVVAKDIVPNFQQTGTWYEFFSRETLQVDNVSNAITLQPGEYRLYSTVEFPDHGLALSVAPQPQAVKQDVNVFPNPSDNGFSFVLAANENYHIRIVNIQGQVVFQQKNVLDAANQIYFWNGYLNDGAKATPGIYFYNIYSSEKSVNGKLMVR